MKPNLFPGPVVAALALAVLASFVPACRRTATPPPAPPPAQGPLPLASVRSWAIQMQDVDAQGSIEALAASRNDLLIIEPTCTDWSEPSTKAFDTAAAVARLKGSVASDGVHRKLVLANINIGEAEAWRCYWKWTKSREAKAPRPADWPAFILDTTDEELADDHPVAFWEPEWKSIVIGNGAAGAGPSGFGGLVEEALRDGFDGVYLDWVEAYADERVAEAARKAGHEPAAEMVRFLEEIRKYAQARNPHFLIIQANASDLILESPEAARFVDGVVQEGIWYTGSVESSWDEARGHDVAVNADDTEEMLANLKLYRKAGKPVFALEYAVKNAGIAAKKARANGLVPYCARTALDQLSDTPE